MLPRKRYQRLTISTLLVAWLMLTWVYIWSHYTTLTDNLYDATSHNNEDFHEEPPKIWHQVWLNYTEMPEDWRWSINTCKLMNTNYNYRLWTADSIEELIAREYPWFLETYSGYRYPVQRADAVRYFLLYHYGGVYTDMDIACRQPFSLIWTDQRMSEAEQRGVYLPRTEPFGFSNDFMASTRHHPFFRHVMHQLPLYDHWYGLPYLTVMLSTGPLFLTAAFSSYPYKEEVYHVPHLLYTTRYFRHIQGGTWHSWDSAHIEWLYRVTTYASVIRIMIFVALSLAALVLGCLLWVRWWSYFRYSYLRINV